MKRGKMDPNSEGEWPCTPLDDGSVASGPHSSNMQVCCSCNLAKPTINLNKGERKNGTKLTVAKARANKIQSFIWNTVMIKEKYQKSTKRYTTNARVVSLRAQWAHTENFGQEAGKATCCGPKALQKPRPDW